MISRIATIERSVFEPISEPGLPLHLLSMDELGILERYVEGQRIKDECVILENIILPKLTNEATGEALS